MMVQSLDIDSVFERCMRAYFHECEQTPGIVIPTQPSRAASHWLDDEEDVFVLRSYHGALARYKVTANDAGGVRVEFIEEEE
jgi:hypothetical protein